MKNILFFTTLMWVVLSCGKHGYVPPTSVTIHYIDSSGNDLFTNGTNGFFKDSVRIFDWANGIKTLIYLSKDNYPYGYDFNPPAGYGPGFIRIAGYNQHVVDEYVTNIIHLKPGIDDTLKCHVIPNSNLNFDKIWYNGVSRTDIELYMTIKK